jgi:hypothetical protein
MNFSENSLSKLLLLLLFCAITSAPLLSMSWEFGMDVKNASGARVSRAVYLYDISNLTAPLRQGITDTVGDPNFQCDIEVVDLQNPTWPAISAGT